MWNNVRVMQKITAVCAVVATLGLVYAGVLWAANQSWFAIKNIHIIGDVQHISLAQARTHIAQRMSGTFFTASLLDAKRLVETLPWVRRATITRSWPNTLVIELQEHAPFALFNENQVINTHGESFTVNLDELPGRSQLPFFSGPVDAAAQIKDRYQALLTSLRSAPAFTNTRIEKLRLSERLSWSASLSGGLNLELGRDTSDEAVLQRLARLLRYWPSATHHLGVPTRVDLRYPDGFVFSAPGLRTVESPPKQKKGL